MSYRYNRSVNFIQQRGHRTIEACIECIPPTNNCRKIRDPVRTCHLSNNTQIPPRSSQIGTCF